MITVKQIQQLAGMLFRDGIISADDLNDAIIWPECYPPVIADKKALKEVFGIGEDK